MGLYTLYDVCYFHSLKQSTAIVVVANRLTVSVCQHSVSSYGILHCLIKLLGMVRRHSREVS